MGSLPSQLAFLPTFPRSVVGSRLGEQVLWAGSQRVKCLMISKKTVMLRSHGFRAGGASPSTIQVHYGHRSNMFCEVGKRRTLAVLLVAVAVVPRMLSVCASASSRALADARALPGWRRADLRAV